MKQADFNRDPHTYHQPGQPTITHIDWEVYVDFETHTLRCTSFYNFGGDGETHLDIKGLKIESIVDEKTEAIPFTVSPSHPVLGECLTFTVPKGRLVQIRYTTSPEASGLQWLPPEQTLGKRHPFLFSQGECLHTPSFLPCQQSPRVRVTYNGTLIVPKALRGLMAARHVQQTRMRDFTVETWQMRLPIPAYLIAFAVGDLHKKDISSRCCVWAEEPLVEAAAAEFKDLGKMVAVGEALFGTYEWGRYDLLFLPPTFPYGGMENPGLAFLTPSLVTGDGSMVQVVTHELAHHWFGNLIANGRWGDFWLNEGWTVWADWKMQQHMYGKKIALLQRALLERELEQALARFRGEGRPELTALATSISRDVDPDDVFSRVPYCKGALFLSALENAVSEEQFLRFARAYIERFRFKSVTTSEFLDFLAKELPGAFERVQGWRWVYEGGLPDTYVPEKSVMVDAVTEWARSGKLLRTEVAEAWNPLQWVLFLELLPRPVSLNTMLALELMCSLSRRANIEVRWTYFLLALEAGGHDRVRNEVEVFLASTGRMKYIVPVFQKMAKGSEANLAWARSVFERLRPTYHPIAVGQIERVLREAQEAQVI